MLEANKTSNESKLEHDLLITQVRVGRHSARCLIDSGATHNFAAAEWIEEAGITTSENQAEISLTMADGRRQLLKETVTPRLRLDIGGHVSWETLTVIPLQGYDMVLGMPWLSRQNPDVDFTNNIVTLSGEGGNHNVTVTCVSRDDPPDNTVTGAPRDDPLDDDDGAYPAEFMSIKQARRALKKGAQCIIVTVQEDSSPDATAELRVKVDGNQRAELLNVLDKHSSCFPKELPMELPPRRRTDHEIDVEAGAKPPSRPPYRLSQPELGELQRQLEKLLQHGFIEPSKSPFGAPVFFVKKADGSLRLVCDWRPLNNITVKTQACLPNIDDLFDTVRGARYFSKLDLMSGYHQVRIREEDIPKTAVNTPFGQFQFRVMGFGLTNAPATFMSMMNDVLRPFLRKCVIVFLDDILVFSHSWAEHLCHLDCVLSALEKEKLYCKRTKCEFAATSLKFLGHIISGQTIGPDPEKLQAVESWSTPRSVTDIRRFLGFANYFRRFIQDYATIAQPLEVLTGKHTRFAWGSLQQQAFNALKQALISAPVLRLADVTKPFRVVTDASDTALGGVLLQQESSAAWLPIAYTSRRLRPEEQNYTAMERETLAVLHALRVWKLYLFAHFDVITDNQGVKYLRTKTNVSKREARWIDFLADFDFTIVHCPGRENMADALSRSIANVEVTLQQDEQLQELLASGYAADNDFKSIVSGLVHRDEQLQRRYHWDSSQERLYLKDNPEWRLCVPVGPLRRRLLGLCHDSISSGHPGRDRTYTRLARSYYWPRMGRFVARYVKACRVCQRSKGNKSRENRLQPLPVPSTPWECIGMDFITDLPTSPQGNDAILTFIDRLTKQAHFVATNITTNAHGVAELYMQHVYRLHGLSKSIVSDRDPRFTAELYRAIFRRLGVRLDFSTANHPQTDGVTERVHRTIGQILRSAVNHRQNNWEEILPMCEFAYNDMVQGSTCETPFYLNYGHHPLSAADPLLSAEGTSCDEAQCWIDCQKSALNEARDSIQDAIRSQEIYANRTRHNSRFRAGDQVMVHRDYMTTSVSRDQPCSKLKPRWFGPFTVEKSFGSTVRLELPRTCRAHPVFNTAALKMYLTDEVNPQPPAPPPVIDQDGHERFIVEAVISERRHYGRQQYLVKWKGYDEPTWEPASYLMDESGSPIVPLHIYLQK